MPKKKNSRHTHRHTLPNNAKRRQIINKENEKRRRTRRRERESEAENRYVNKKTSVVVIAGALLIFRSVFFSFLFFLLLRGSYQDLVIFPFWPSSIVYFIVSHKTIRIARSRRLRLFLRRFSTPSPMTARSSAHYSDYCSRSVSLSLNLFVDWLQCMRHSIRSNIHRPYWIEQSRMPNDGLYNVRWVARMEEHRYQQ